MLPNYEWAVPRWLEVALPDTSPSERSGFDRQSPVTADNPPRMVFVVADACPVSLPTELGTLHMPGLPADSRVLAPWAIDEATDGLFAARCVPEEVFSLATDSLRGLFWGLHDWAHFHSHGPFERVAETELQCDVAALVWLWDNRALIDLTRDELLRLAGDVAGLWRARFSAENRPAETRRAWTYVAHRTGVAELARQPAARD